MNIDCSSLSSDHLLSCNSHPLELFIILIKRSTGKFDVLCPQYSCTVPLSEYILILVLCFYSLIPRPWVLLPDTAVSDMTVSRFYEAEFHKNPR